MQNLLYAVNELMNTSLNKEENDYGMKYGRK